MTEWIGIAAVLLLVAANGFFVAAELALVAMRRSRVAELVAQERRHARALLIDKVLATREADAS